ncbi:MAG: BrxA/BrxB family bacilliredoxin [Bacteroidia bacterium]|nr:BrxA/BrxB family bacilliredoxin [Bacteroidia bacterium]MDW8347562.1 BrxA/BrxB family bacilliredoxin [Bacteroidia bacterium]
MYDPRLVQPMRQELINAGFEELLTPEQVEAVLNQKKGTVFLVINSVCGCAAGSARPGVKYALQNARVKPDKLVTVFAGQDKAATEKAREYLVPIPPSSPSMYLFKDGQLVHVIERRHIEGTLPQVLADNLIGAFEMYCN